MQTLANPPRNAESEDALRRKAANLLEPKEETDLAAWLKEAEQRIRDKLTDGPLMM